MPYIIVRGNLASYGRTPWRVLVSGLKANDIEQLNRFPSGGYSDDSTIVYLQHPCTILTALEVLGYSVIASSSTTVKQDYNEYMWTMRKDFLEPEPDVVVPKQTQYGDLDRVATLLRKGTDVNTEDKAGYTALHYASRNGHHAVCQHLIAAGANVHAQTRAGASTPLHRSSFAGHLDVVKLLLASRADCEAVDADGKTPLHKAVEGGRRDVVGLLLQAAPKAASRRDSRGRTAEQLAKDGMGEIAELFARLN